MAFVDPSAKYQPYQTIKSVNQDCPKIKTPIENATQYCYEKIESLKKVVDVLRMRLASVSTDKPSAQTETKGVDKPGGSYLVTEIATIGLRISEIESEIDHIISCLEI